MRHSYIAPGIVDGAVVRKQAERNLMDKYWPEETVVHAHAHNEYCNDDCVIYKFPQKECTDCNGTGRQQPEEGDYVGLAKQFSVKPCLVCRGTGEVRDPDRKPGEAAPEGTTADVEIKTAQD